MTSKPRIEGGLNWKHYSEASRIYHRFMIENFSDVIEAHKKANPQNYIPLKELKIAPENLLRPQKDFFSLYCDILGFSAGVLNGKGDNLPDFYGAAFTGAIKHPNVKVYLLSDSCLAFAKIKHCKEFINFVKHLTENLAADSILSQSLVGYGSFIERLPNFSMTPHNFFGRQVVGTALIDAFNLKTEETFGARILLSLNAYKHWPNHAKKQTIRDGNGQIEFLPSRPSQFDLFDCIYYLLCLRDKSLEKRVSEQYIWSLASRNLRLGVSLTELAISLVAKEFNVRDIKNLLKRINSVLSLYQKEIK